MPAHPFVYYPPLAASALADVLRLFSPTFVVLAAVLTAVTVLRHRERWASVFRRRLRRGLADRRRRVPALPRGASGLWALPLLAWACQSSYQMWWLWHQWNHPTSAMALLVLFESALALALLVGMQSLAVLAFSGPAPPRLGVGGGMRVAVRCAIATIFVDGFLLAWILPTHY